MKAEELQYRPYIDGLRAIAVVAVIVFHLDEDIFPGGYLGVDIFFVISGFVISQSLYKNYLTTGRVELKRFYTRRIQRLYPALVVMVSVTTLLYFFIGFLWEKNLLVKSSITSVLGISNFFYLKQADNYFHQDLINPLLHTWSLGVEEQFYLIYPLILLALLYFFCRFRCDSLYIALLLLLGSVTLYVTFVLSAGSVYGDFYFPTARFWELLAGCTVFFFSLKYKVRSANFIFSTGIIVLLGVQFFQSKIENLYIELLVTVLATSVVIFAGDGNKKWTTRLVGSLGLVSIGKISYSLYLWHMPTIYFANLYLTSYSYYVVTICTTVICGLLSYRYIELPFRKSETLNRFILRMFYPVLLFALAIGLVLAVVGPSKVIQKVNISLNAFNDSVKKINYIESQYQLGKRIQPSYFHDVLNVAERCDSLIEDSELTGRDVRGVCNKGTKSHTLFYVTGDSHAEHFLPMLDSSETDADIYFYPINRRLIADISTADLSTKTEIEKQIKRLEVASGQYQEIYLISSYYLSQYKDMETVAQNLERYVDIFKPYAKLIFVAPTPVFMTGPQSCVVMGVHCNLDKNLDQLRRSELLKVYSDLKNRHHDVFLYDPYDEICPGESCVIYDEYQNLVRYMDDDHLSVEGSKILSSHFDNWFLREVLSQ